MSLAQDCAESTCIEALPPSHEAACLQPRIDRIDAAGLQITSPGCLAGVFLSLAGRSNRVGCRQSLLPMRGCAGVNAARAAPIDLKGIISLRSLI